jgi:hypothetical protein
LEEVSSPDPRIMVNAVLQGLPILGLPAEYVVPYIHGITDFIPRNIQGGDQFYWKYIARDESELHNHLKTQTTGKGFDHDPILVGKTISDSLSSYPELQQLYHGR